MLALQQPEFALDRDVAAAQARCELRSHLKLHGWQTRKELSLRFGWSERYIRELAESLGSEIVRGQAGFKLTDSIEREDLAQALQAADAFLSQGKRMIRYALALKKRLHQKVGGA